MTATFNWTPTTIGQTAVSVIFQDDANQSCNKNFTLDVIDPDLPPVANAGADGNVNEGGSYSLDGSASYDPKDEALTYSWTQISGTPVSLSDNSIAKPTFTAPWLNSNETLTFRLSVSDGKTVNSATVNVTIIANNHPPVSDAGNDGTIKEGATRILDGSLSYDSDNEMIQSYVWTQVAGPTVTLLGEHSANASFTPDLISLAGQSLTFQLQTSDGKELSSLSSLPDLQKAGDDLVTVKVVANSKPIANAGNDETKNENSTVELDGSLSNDPDGDSISYTWVQTSGIPVVLSNNTVAKPTFTAPWVNAGGVDLTFSLVVKDNDSVNSKSSIADTVSIHVVNDNDPPSCNKALPSVDAFWPPNHTMQEVGILNVSDVTDETVVLSITNVTQDEPTNNTGDGDTSPDASFNGNKLLLRAERAGNKDGRVYKVNFTATDGKESCNGSIKVSVPQSRQSKAIDSGQSVDSTKP